MSAITDPQHFRRIAQAAGSGKLAEAALEVVQMRAAGNTDPRLAALGGAIEFHRAEFARAVPLLAEANHHFPADTVVLGNLVEALYRTEQAEDAYALCSDAAVNLDKSGRLSRLKAFLAQETGRFNDAIATYHAIVAAEPGDWSSWNNLGNSYSAIRNYPPAVEALQRALELAPDLQPTRINLGNVMIEGGDPFTGEIVLREAADRDPTDPIPLRSLYEHYWKSARDNEALVAITEAARRSPADPVLHSEFAREAAKHNKYDVSDAAYRHVLTLDPVSTAAFIGLATNLDRTNRDDEFLALREEAAVTGVAGEVLDYIDALRFGRLQDYEKALAALDRSGGIGPGGRNFHMRGVLLDRLGRYDEAFATYGEMNEAAANHPSDPRGRAAQYRDLVAQSRAIVTPEWLASWTPHAVTDHRAPPVFLGSFPRSGTTLLDTMLMALPGAIVLEEQPFIAQMQQEAGGIAGLAAMDSASLQAAVDTYWSRVGEHGAVSASSIVIDKQPLHTNSVAAIARLFPQAKFVFALRHPCDVLLSCYLTNFRTNNAMANFLDLDVAADLYAQTLEHWEQSQRVFGLACHTVVYERLVEDTARELRPLYNWLGHDLPDDYVDHRDAARARGLVTTASYSQVTEPIYTRAKGRWHNYRRQLEPVFDRLRPWADKYGYSLEDDRIPPWPVTQVGAE